MKKILLFLVLLVVAAAGTLSYGWTLVGQPYCGYSGEIVVDIPAGFGSEEIVDLLLTRGVLQHRYPSLAYLYFSPYRGKAQAGEYLFDEPLNVEGVFGKLARGEIRLHPFTVPEGLILVEIADSYPSNVAGLDLSG